jgi:FKBP-type peptidyl-prolyl cis-trans isomerase FklB
MAYMQKQYAAKNAEAGKAAEGNKKIGAAFLAENKSKPGVQTTSSGLQYIVEKEGTGAKPVATDRVKVHYTGTLIDGKVFDSSVQRGQPAEFGVTEVIKGWTEVLQLMPVGSKWKVFIPSDIAYGDRGAGADIGPGSTLIFDIELLDIVKSN